MKNKDIIITFDEICESQVIEHDQKFVFIEDHETKVEYLEAKLKVAVEAALAYQELTICYRLGKLPSEKLFGEIRKASVFLEENEKIKAK